MANGNTEMNSKIKSAVIKTSGQVMELLQSKDEIITLLKNTLALKDDKITSLLQELDTLKRERFAQTEANDSHTGRRS